MLGEALCLVLLLLFFPAVLSAEGEEAADPFAVDAMPTVPPSGPDYLVPLDNSDSEWRKPYVAKLDAKLKPKDFAWARMICRPSFEGESIVFIHGEEKDRELEKTEKFRVTARIAQTSIWYSLPDNNDEKADKEVKISSFTIPLEKDLALRLINIWNRMLERTREPEEGVDGLDGVTFEFSVSGKIGEIWSPTDNVSPGMLANIGLALQKYAESEANAREALAKELKVKVLRLEKYLAERPLKK